MDIRLGVCMAGRLCSWVAVWPGGSGFAAGLLSGCDSVVEAQWLGFLGDSMPGWLGGRGGSVARWLDGWLAKWLGGSVAGCRGGWEAQWLSGSVAGWLGSWVARGSVAGWLDGSGAGRLGDWVARWLGCLVARLFGG